MRVTGISSDLFLLSENYTNKILSLHFEWHTSMLSFSTMLKESCGNEYILNNCVVFFFSLKFLVACDTCFILGKWQRSCNLILEPYLVNNDFLWNPLFYQ